jgi:DNA-binding transcriptional ArsR family regulator
MASIERTEEDADEDPVPTPTAQKRKLSKSFKLDGTKKFGRTAKGRKVARQHAKEKRESGTAPFRNPPWKKLCVPSQHPFFKKIPGELRKEILSHLPLEVLGSIRKLGQQFQMVVSNFETDLTQPTITFHINRLQATIDAINATKMPTDADSLLACMRTWTSTRGSFRNPEVSLDSLNKWFSHLAGGELPAKHGEPEKNFQRWADLLSWRRSFNVE